MNNTEIKRQDLINSLFPYGFPKLWCPLLTHYKENSNMDFERIAKHLDFILPYCNSFLIPGSTGDGWELDFEEFKMILNFVFNYKIETKINIVIGILQTDVTKRKNNFEYAFDIFRNNTRFKGFVLCPPVGENLNRSDIEKDLCMFLDCKYPIVLYQLPQVTHNELIPDTIEFFADSFYNFYMLKDSSGKDKIAKAGKNYRGVKLIRGAELDYCKWLKNPKIMHSSEKVGGVTTVFC